MDSNILSLRKEFRKFRNLDYYDQSESRQPYSLMPFNFHRINDDLEVLINEVGDFLLVPTGTAGRIINKELDKEYDSSLYADLLSNFFISESAYSPLIDLLATRYRTKKLFLENFTSLHIFVISLRCEHTCHYCQVSRVTQDRSKYDMSREHIDRGIELMMKSPNPNVTMEFQGGEALLAFDNIKYAIGKAQEQAYKYRKNVNYVICTNLALINDEILQFCKLNDVLISTSLDGPKHVHDSNRHKPHASSYELTIQGIKRVKEVLGNDSVSALMTTSKLSLDHPTEIVDEYFNLGFQGIFLRNISPYGFALRTEKNRYLTKEYLDFFKKGLQRIIEINKNERRFVEGLSQILLTKMLTPMNVGFVDMQSPSGIINGVIVFNYDGGIYASDESRMLAEERDFTFKLGHLDETSYDEVFFGDKANKISAVWANESLAGCADCAFQQYCGADPVHNWATQGDLYGYRPTSSFCEKNMEIIRYLFELMATDQDVKEIFESWIRI